MKRTDIIFPILFSFVCLFACSEEYIDPSDNSLTGTWVVDSIYPKGESVNDRKSHFIVMRDGIINFHTEGIYDSSYFFTEDNNNLLCRRLTDTTTIIRKYDSIGKNNDTIHKIDTVRLPMKPLNPDPLNPKHAYSMEYKYFTTYSFEDDKLVFKFYPSENPNEQTENNMYKIMFFVRGKQQ